VNPAESEVRRVVYLHNGSSTFLGVKLFDKDGNKLLETASWNAYNNHFNKKKTIELAEGERIIGIKSTSRDQYCAHDNLQFVIGRLE
jgi:hypothetical protein